MDPPDVMKQVATELTHIPRWPGEHQGSTLQAIYELMRVNDLGAKKVGSAGEVLHHCIAIIWRDVPDARVELRPSVLRWLISGTPRETQVRAVAVVESARRFARVWVVRQAAATARVGGI